MLENSNDFKNDEILIDVDSLQKNKKKIALTCKNSPTDPKKNDLLP